MTKPWLRRNIHGSIRFCLKAAQTLDEVRVMAAELHAELENMPEADRPKLRKGAAKGIRFVPLNDLSRCFGAGRDRPREHLGLRQAGSRAQE